MTTETKLPIHALQANIAALGRSLEGAEFIAHGWNGDEYGIIVRWPDGFEKWLGMGAEASALIQHRFASLSGCPNDD